MTVVSEEELMNEEVDAKIVNDVEVSGEELHQLFNPRISTCHE